jgi:hypothetical protein
MDRTHFLIGESSPTMQVVLKHEGQFKVFAESIEAFRKKHGAESALAYGNRSFAGLRFSGQVPKGWRQRQDGAFVPDSRCKDGRGIKKEVDALPRGFDAWTFSSELGESYLHFTDGNVHFSTFAKYGDQYVLSVPAVCRAVPEGCTELKMTEYWQIREATTPASHATEESSRVA